jgi:hypothetical protein
MGSGRGARTRRLRRRAAILAIAAVAITVLTSGPATSATPPTPVYSPPPAEVSPFTARDAFCSKTNNAFVDVKPDDPRLATKLTVVMLVPAPNPLAATAEPGLVPGSTADEAQAFASLVNACGGIGGRKLDFHVLTETADPTADCLAATQVLHALVVVSLAASPAESCIVDDQHTVLVTESDVSNAALATAQGRLAGTGSTEGVLQARILDVIDSGRLRGKHVAIVVGTGPADLEFRSLAGQLLRAAKIPTTTVDRADVLLTSALDVPGLIALAQKQTTVPSAHQAVPQVYGFSDPSDLAIDQLRQVGGSAGAQAVQSVGVFSYTPIQDEEHRLGQSAGTFATVCNKAYATSFGGHVTPTDAPQPSPPAASDAPYLGVARVCLAMRIVSRALFNAGIDVNQASLVKALYRLPYIDDVLPDETKIPRPNQIVNEPVHRVAQVLVLSQAEYPCQHPSWQEAGVDNRVCWAPVPGWDGGGRVVNAPLLAPSAFTSPAPSTG